ncbi:MAG: hypothetical protein H7843_03165 [Nitrospirota bacterium]
MGYKENAVMQEIIKKYVLDAHNNKVAVEIDIETFSKIEEILEYYGLYHLMIDADDPESLNLEQAKKDYRSAPKYQRIST